MRRLFSPLIDKVAFPLGAAVLLCATIWIVYTSLTYPIGMQDESPPGPVPHASIRYVAGLAAWGPDIGARQITAFYEHWQRIAGELRAPHAVWAGHYQPRDNSRASLVLAPRNGVAVIYRDGHGAIGNVGLAEGRAQLHGDYLEITYTSRQDLPAGRLPARMYPVVWGAHHYLMSETELGGLVAALNAQGAFPDALVSSLLENTTDPAGPPRGRLVLPQPFAAALNIPVAPVAAVKSRVGR